MLTALAIDQCTSSLAQALSERMVFATPRQLYPCMRMRIAQNDDIMIIKIKNFANTFSLTTSKMLPVPLKGSYFPYILLTAQEVQLFITHASLDNISKNKFALY